MFTVLSATNAVGVKSVNAIAANLSDLDIANAAVGYLMLPTGETQTREGAPYSTVGTWLLQGTADEYEVRLTGTGDTPSGSALNTWLPLDTNQGWELVQNSPGSLQFSGTVEIRRASNQVILDFASLIMLAEVN
jgi:hypothetical protein